MGKVKEIVTDYLLDDIEGLDFIDYDNLDNENPSYYSEKDNEEMNELFDYDYLEDEEEEEDYVEE